MKTIEQYTDDELSRLLSKTVGTVGGADRAKAIQTVLNSRGVQSDRTTLFNDLNRSILGQ